MQDSGDVEFKYDIEVLKKNSVVLMEQLFNDIGLKPWNELHPQLEDN